MMTFPPFTHWSYKFQGAFGNSILSTGEVEEPDLIVYYGEKYSIFFYFQAEFKIMSHPYLLLDKSPVNQRE